MHAYSKSNVIRERTLMLRKLGGVRKLSMDYVDKIFFVDCIMDKATAHGRMHGTVMYFNQSEEVFSANCKFQQK